jgi:hypothetical protein
MVMRLRDICICATTLVVTSGCQSEEKTQQAPQAEASASAKPEGPALDPALAKAMADAAKPGAPGAATQGGPPPKGIFAPGEADRQIAVGAAPQLTLGSNGSEPRARLTSGFGTKDKPLQRHISIALQAGPQQGALPVEFDVDFVQEKPEANAARSKVTAKVVGATLPQGLPVPPEVSAAMTKLRGSSVRFEVWPDGGATGFQFEAPKDAPPNLGDILRTLGDSIAAVTLPFPQEAVGAGGFWMATSRDGLMGLDLVTYRMVRVESIADGVAKLNVGSKRYATGTKFAMEALQGNFTLDEFVSTSDGILQYPVGVSVPVDGQLRTVLAASLIPAEQPDQRGTLQLGSQATFSLRGAKAQASGGVKTPALPKAE